MDKNKYFNHDPRNDGYNHQQNPEYNDNKAPHLTNNVQVQPKDSTVMNQATDNTSQIPPSNAITQINSIALRAPQKSTDSKKQVASNSKPVFMDSSDDDDYLQNISRPQTPPELKGFDEMYEIKCKPGTTNNGVNESRPNAVE